MKKFTLLFAAVMYCSFAIAQIPLGSLDFPVVLNENTPADFNGIDFSFLEQGSFNTIEVHSLNSGNWSNPLNWDCGCTPAFIHEVFIESGHAIDMTENRSAHTLHIANEASLMLGVGTNLELHGSFYNNGLFEAAEARITIIGQEEDHYLQIGDELGILEANHAGQIHLISSLEINEYGNLISSVLNANGLLTIKQGTSDFHGIRVDELSELLGNVSITRTFNHPVNSWLSLACPLYGTTFEDWDEELATTGFPGSDSPGSSFVSIIAYDETQTEESAAYYGPQSSDDLIAHGLGYYVYSAAGMPQVEMSGTVQTEAIDFYVYRTEQDNFTSAGLNFLGNPYPASLNWNSSEGWSRNGIGAALYIWNSETRTVNTFTSGIGVNGADGSIDIAQSFWVRALDTEPSMQVNPAALSYDNISEVETEVLSLTLIGSNGSDEIALGLHDEASLEFDAEFDAYKYYSGSLNAEIAWGDGIVQAMSIQRVHSMPESIELPILLTVNLAGTYSLNISNSLSISNSMCIILEDIETGEMHNVSENIVIEFETLSGNNLHRFNLHFGQMATATDGIVSCAGDEDADVVVNGTGDGPWAYTWYNEMGMIIRQTDGLSGADIHENLGPGIYTIVITNNDLCASLSVEAEVVSPEPIGYFSNQQNVPCGENASGSIELNISGGVPPYTYNWSNGASGNIIFDLGGGIYTLNLIDSSGCEQEYSFEIDEAEDVVAQFNPSALITLLVNGQALIDFDNTSVAATTYSWDFGDGSILSTQVNPDHTYYEEGLYIVTLTASNDDCTSQYNAVIQIESTSSITEAKPYNELRLSRAGEAWYIETPWTTLGLTEVDVFNLLGQQLIPTWKGEIASGKIWLGEINGTGPMLIQIRRKSDQQTLTIKGMR